MPYCVLCAGCTLCGELATMWDMEGNNDLCPLIEQRALDFMILHTFIRQHCTEKRKDTLDI